MSLHHYTEGPPGSTFSGPLMADLEKGITKAGSPTADVLFELTDPGGTVWKLAFVPVDGAEPRVASVDWPIHGVQIFQDDFAAPELTIHVNDDPARTFGALVAKYPRSLRGSAIRMRVAAKGLGTPDELRADGIVDLVGLEAPGLWAIRMRANDRPLSDGFFLTEKVGSQFPNAHASAKGQCLPLVYGEHSSVGVGGNGAVPCLCVDTTTFSYMPTVGRGEAVDAVYADGVLVAPANYSTLRPTTGGLWWTEIRFTTSQADKVITCDIRGLTDKGDGTGTLIRNRIAQARHFLVNFVWNKWRQGAYYAETSAPLDLASFAELETFLARSSDPEGARAFSGSQPVRCADALREILSSSKVKAYYTPAFRLAVGLFNIYADAYPEGFGPTAGNPDGDPIDFDVHAKDALAIPYDSTSLVRNILVSHLQHSAEGQYKGALTVADLSVPDEITESLELPWSAARVK